MPLQSEEREGRKISSRIEAATNSEEEDRLYLQSANMSSWFKFIVLRKIVRTAKSCQWTPKLQC